MDYVENAAMKGFLYKPGGRVSGFPCSNFYYGSDSPDAGHLGGMVKLKPAPSSINKVTVLNIHKHNGTSQRNKL